MGILGILFARVVLYDLCHLHIKCFEERERQWGCFSVCVSVYAIVYIVAL